MDSFQGEVVQLSSSGDVSGLMGVLSLSQESQLPISTPDCLGTAVSKNRFMEDSDLTERNRAVETTFSFRFCPLPCHLLKAALAKPGSRGQSAVGAKRLAPSEARQDAPARSTLSPYMSPTPLLAAARPPWLPFREDHLLPAGTGLFGQVDNRASLGGPGGQAGTEPGLGSPPSAPQSHGGWEVGAGLGGGLTSPRGLGREGRGAPKPCAVSSHPDCSVNRKEGMLCVPGGRSPRSK